MDQAKSRTAIRTIVAAALSVVLTLALAGCGSGGDGGAAPDTSRDIANTVNQTGSASSSASPVITSTSRLSAVGASYIEILGRNFGGAQFTSASYILFTRANGETILADPVTNPQDWTDSRIRVLVPGSLAAAEVITMQVRLRGGAVAGGVESNRWPLSISAAQSPVVTSVQPQGAIAGQQVTIRGQNFGDAQLASSAVLFPGTGGTLINGGTALQWTDTEIVMRLPAGTSSGPVIISKGSLQSTPNPNTYSDDLVVSDNTAPSLVSAGPADGTSAVDPRIVIQLVFSEAMGPGVTDPLNYILTSSAGTVSIANPIVQVSANTYRLTPLTPLQGSTRWTLNQVAAVGRTPIGDLAGNALLGLSISFTTAEVPGVGDKVSPLLLSTTPANDDVNVDVNTSVVLSFNEPVLVAGSAVRFTSSGGDVTGTIQVSPATFGTLVVVKPPRLVGNTLYYFNVSSSVVDQGGNPFAGRTVKFTTMDVPGQVGSDITPPRLVSSNPTNGTSGVSPSTVLLLTFSEQMSSSVSVLSNYRLTTEGGAITPDTATASGPSVILGFNPGKLLVDTQYTLFLLPGLKDRAGNALEPSSPIGFKTALIQGQPGDRVAPLLTLANPADGTEDVDVNTSLVLQFNEPVRLSAAHLRFTSSGGDHSGPITVSPTSGFASLYVVSPGRLIGKTSYLVSISSEVKDQVGNPFGGRTLNIKTMDVQGLPGSDITPPRLLSASPTSGSSSVNPNTQILLAFSEQLSSTGSQVANYRITTSGGVYPIAGASMTGTSVILSFSGPLLVDTSYTLLLLPTLTDRAGNALAPTDPLTFRTALIQGQPGDRTPPRVATLNPADNSTGVGIHSEIYLTFSEAMNQTQMLSVSNYQLSTSGGSVPLTATFVNSSAVRLVPTVASLRGDTEYSLLLTSALTDLMGNPLSPVAVSFRTATATGVPGADFTAPTLVSSNPTSGTSDVDPNSLVVLVFSEEMGASAASASSYRFTTQTGVPIFPTNVTVTGTGVVLGFGAQGMLTETNYTLSLINLSDKAGNALQPIAPITFRTATIPGKPGDRTVPSVTAISPADNGVVGIYTQFYITYSEAMGASAWSASNYSLTTSGGLFPITVTYLSPTAVQISPTRVLIGNIGYKLSLSGGIQDVQGNRLLARIFDYQSEDVPGIPGSDVTPPVLGGSQPATGDDNVDPYVSPVLGFSEALDPATAQSVVNYTFTTDGALTETHPLTATVVGTNVVLEFGSPLLVDSRYTIRLSNDLTDLAGNRLVAATPVRFKTRAIAGMPGDTTAPTVTSVNPADSTTVGVNSDIYITFSEPVNLTPTPSTAPFQLTTPGGAYPFTGSSRINSSSLRLTPKKPLQGGITYNLVITSDITDTQGNPLEAFSSSFSAATVPGSAGSDFTAPTLLSANPYDGQQNVDPDTRIVLTFSEPMELSNIVTVGVTSTSNYRISSDSSSFNPTRVDMVSSPPNSVSLNVGRLAGNTTYAVILSNSLKDKAGNALVAQAIGFRTANVALPGADSTPPQLSDTNPRNGSDSASLQTQITVIFSEPVNDISPTVPLPTTQIQGLNSALWIGNYSLFSAFGDVGIAQVQKLGYPPNAYLLTPATTSLRGGTTYTLVPSNRILDKAGNGLISSQIAFTTVDQPGTGVGDVTAPQVISVQPPNDAQVINPNTNIIFTFSEEMYEAGAVADTYSITSTGNWTILAPYDKEAATAADQQVPTRIEKLSVPPNAYKVDFGTPDNALPRTDCYYIVELSNRIRDLAGNPLTPTKIAFQQGSPPTKPKVDSTSIDNSPIATNSGEFITVTFNKQVTDAGGDGNANNFELLGYCTDITGTASEVIQIASVNPINSNDGSPRQAFQVQLRGATLQGANFRLIKNASYVLVVKGYHALVSGTDYINQADYSKTYRALNQ